MGKHNKDPGAQRAELIKRLAVKAGKVALGLAIATSSVTALGYTANVVANHEVGVGDNVPNKLPPAVAAAIGKAVYLYTDLPPSLTQQGASQPGDMDKNLALSGVNLGNGYFLSAGHALKNPKNQPLSPIQCGNYSVSGTLPSGYSYTAQANKAAARVDLSRNTDISVFQFSANTLQELAGAGATLPTGSTSGIQIATEQPKKGDTLYFINWEPTASGESRDPMSTENRLARPAIFAGTVLSNNNGLATVVTGERNYGDGGIPDTSGRPGESGGMVLNQYGQLVGLSNYGTTHSSIVGDIEQAALNMHIGPFGLPSNGEDINWVDIVSRAQVRYWERQAAESASCPFDPDAQVSTMLPSRQYNALGA